MKPEIRPKDEPKKKTPEEIEASERAAYTERCMKFGGKDGGIAFAFIYRPHFGFANYAVVKLQLKDGKVDKVINVSQAYGAGEAHAWMEIEIERHLAEMKKQYPGDYRHV